MKISTETRSAARHTGIEKAIENIAKAGFDAFDLSMLSMVSYNWSTNEAVMSNDPLAGADYLAHARKLKQIGLDNGIVCNQTHAPYPTYCSLIRDCFKRSIECTAEAGGDICVIHPDHFQTVEQNVEMFLELLPFAKSHGVKIAAENMWGWSDEKQSAARTACSDPENFLAHLNGVNDEYFVACLDIGHAEMKGLDTSAAELIDALGGHLQCLHIHDNDFLHDSHQIPFSMEIDFDSVAKALKRNGYQGYLTLEAVSYLNNRSAETVLDGLCDMANAARKLGEMIEK